MTEFELLRNNPHIDPALQIWGWEIAVYLFLGGLAAGAMILAGAAKARESRTVRLLVFVAPLAISLGMLALFLDLEQKLHVFRFYTTFQLTSPMSWGAWILLLIYPATILYGLAQLGFAFAQKHEELLRRLNIALGIALGAYTGILLGTLTARAAWSSLFLAPLFLASGLSAAAALALLLPVSESDRDTLRKWDLAAIGLEVVLLGLFFLDLIAAGARGRAAASLFFGGPYTAAFWSLVVIAGLAVPALLEVFEMRQRMHAAIAPALVLIGGLSLRWIFVLAGQAAI